MPMRVLRSTDYRRMPWKNGKGETVEIAVFPQDASVDDFDWRISMATVAEDGPFSVFEGVDRTLSVLSGDGIALSVEGRDTVDLTIRSAPYTFPADATTSARLLGPPITDLNVMTRRGRWVHRVSRHEAMDGPISAIPAGPTFVIAMEQSRLLVEGTKESTSLAPLDCLLLTPGNQRITFCESAATSLFIIRFEPAETR